MEVSERGKIQKTHNAGLVITLVLEILVLASLCVLECFLRQVYTICLHRGIDFIISMHTAELNYFGCSIDIKSVTRQHITTYCLPRLLYGMDVGSCPLKPQLCVNLMLSGIMLFGIFLNAVGAKV